VVKFVTITKKKIINMPVLLKTADRGLGLKTSFENILSQTFESRAFQNTVS
jgi:hypothetical protein